MSESEQAANAEALVGKNAMSGFLAVIYVAPADIKKLNSAINNYDGTAEEMAETMQDNLAGQLTILKSPAKATCQKVFFYIILQIKNTAVTFFS